MHTGTVLSAATRQFSNGSEYLVVPTIYPRIEAITRSWSVRLDQTLERVEGTEIGYGRRFGGQKVRLDSAKIIDFFCGFQPFGIWILQGCGQC